MFCEISWRRWLRRIMHECALPRDKTGEEAATQREREQEEEQEGWEGTSREEGPAKGLTRALKIENSKWPIFPADGTETKSRPAFIMTCIAVRAAVICTVSLQNANVDIGKCDYVGTGGGHGHPPTRVSVRVRIRTCIPNHIERRSTCGCRVVLIPRNIDTIFYRKDFGPGWEKKKLS